MLKNIWLLVRILRPKERRHMAFVMTLIVLTSLFDVVGVGAVFVYINLILKPENMPVLIATKMEQYGIEQDTDFLIVMGIGLVTLYIIRILASILSQWSIVRFMTLFYKNASKELFHLFLAKEYDFFLQRHTADIKRYIVDDIWRVSVDLVLQSVTLFAEFLTFIVLLSLLLYVQPELTLSLSVFALLLFMAYLILTRKPLRRYSQQRVVGNSLRHRIANETFAVIKEIHIFSAAKHYFINKFNNANNMYCQAHVGYYMLHALPRLLIEFIVVISLLAIVIVNLLKAEDITHSLSSIILLGAASVRLVPSFIKIFNALTNTRLSQMTFRELKPHLLERLPPDDSCAASERMNLQDSLMLKNIDFTYKGATKPSLNGISLTVSRGASLGIIGSSGAGKSTLIDIIIGLLEPSKGEMVLDGKLLEGKSKEAWRRSIGYIPQRFTLIDATVSANIALGVPENEVNMERVKEVCRIACIDHFIENELPQGYETVVGERGNRISGGQLQRLSIARALYHKPTLLIMDEATSALDPVTEHQVSRSLMRIKKEVTLIIVAHRPGTLDVTDQIIVLDRGVIVDSGPTKTMINKHLGLLGGA